MVHSTINFGTSTPISRHKKRLDRQFSLYQTYAFNMVGAEGLEPSQYCYQWILSPSRLPIPPRPHVRGIIIPRLFSNFNYIFSTDSIPSKANPSLIIVLTAYAKAKLVFLTFSSETFIFSKA